tara:strand:- start:4288 stop:5304 length:1017 start_codon:yes stop_codon:yes gene_type:complete
MLGVGSGSPGAAAALARALELPIETVVDAVYRAPARLLGGVPAEDAERLVEIITGLGLEAAVKPAGHAPPRAPLLDIAGELIEPSRADEVAAILGGFLGTTPAAALEALLTPPGILLGNVSAATYTALKRALPGDAVSLIAADPTSSRYALFASRLTPLQAGVLRPYLPAGGKLEADGSATVFDLSRETADAIWRRMKAPEAVRIFNQAFLRFTILLNAMPDDAVAGAAALEALAGVPTQDYPRLAAVLPVPVQADVCFTEVPARLAAYVEAGFGATAELSTFAGVALDVMNAPTEALAAAGFGAQPPFRTAVMSRPRARLMRARLEAAGAEVLEAVP